MRLLLMSSEFPPGPGGIGTHAYNLTTELASLGWATLVVTPQHYVSDEESAVFNAAQPFLIAHLSPLPFKPLQAAYRLCVASRHIRKHRPDLLLASGARAVWLTAMLAHRHRIPFVAIGHGTEFGSTRRITARINRWAFSHASAVICVSEFTRNRMIVAGIRPRLSQVIENGADPDQFTVLTPREIELFRRSIGFADSRILLTVGQVSERKGQSSVISALPLVLKEFPTVHYVIVGLPTKEKEYRMLAGELGVSEHVHFIGRANGEALLRFMNACEVFVMTSRHTVQGDFEGYGIAVVEAALCGKPAVVSADSGVAEAIVNGVTGYAVAPDDPQAVAGVLVRLLRDDDLRRAMGEAARERAIREQTWDQRAQEYDRFLRALLASPASSKVKVLERESSTSAI